jgi:hypothetical protein
MPTAATVELEPPIASDDAAQRAVSDSKRRWFRWPETPFERGQFSFRVSLVFHAAAMIALALLFQPVVQSTGPYGLIASWQTTGDIDAAAGTLAVDVVAEANETALGVSGEAIDAVALPIDVKPLEMAPSNRVAATPSASSSVTTTMPVGMGVLDELAGIPRGGGLEGRRQRGELAYQSGATTASEEAVERGLSWLLMHQFKDGSWHFDHTLPGGACNGYCRNPGTNGSSTGSTAMALLAFYGAGYSHRNGPYQEQLRRGLYYLTSRMLLTKHGGDLQEGTMYAQGLSAIAMCEAYAMTRDENVRPFAEQAIRFIVYAQDKKGGGWRYSPGEPGDTTMHGWQLMALKSGALAGLSVPSPAWHLAGDFLDGVQTDQGAAYGYRSPQRLDTTTAVGLLCRMYMGWDRKRDAIVRGVAHLDKIGPSPTNMYYNYYATQVMHHFGGSPWRRWNGKMREQLIATQGKTGHEAGSWHFDDQHGDVGGRLYTTAMAIMTLEVYYRYLPLYADRAVNESF